MSLTKQHETLIRTIPDFPLAGIQFKDITPLLAHGEAFQAVVNTLVERYRSRPIDAIVGIESRGFVFSAPVAYALGLGFIPVRKAGKLPSQTHRVSYDLEYGSNTLEIHTDALKNGARVLIVDDLLATGGTVDAACQLVEAAGGTVEELAFLIELEALHGRDRLARYPIYSMITY